MTFPLPIGGMGLLALPVALRRFGRKMVPEDWTRLVALSTIAGSVLAELGFILIALPTVLRAAGVPRMAALCERALGGLSPGGPTLGWVAAVVAVVVGIGGLAGYRRARRTLTAAHVAPWIGDHSPAEGHELVVLPVVAPLALSVPGSPSQVVISQGLAEELAPTALEAVIAHEAAHLEHHHHRFLLLARAIETGFFFFPPASLSTTCLRAGVERWADEESAARVRGGRGAVRTALLEMIGVEVSSDVAAFSGVDGVMDRIEALESAAPVSTIGAAAVYGPTVSLGLLSVASLGLWLGQAHAVLAMAVTCSM